MIIGISGLCIDAVGTRRVAGVGKDTVAKRLLDKHSFVSLAWADPMKRFCREIFEFSDAQLWGESDQRTLPDYRFMREPPSATGTMRQYEHGVVKRDEVPATYLTPRFALQTLGNDWGRTCYKNVWIDYGIRVIQRLQSGGYTYDPKEGLRPCIFLEDDPMARPKTRVVVSDLRYYNEAEAIKLAGGKLVRVKRLLTSTFSAEQMDNAHGSEVELPCWDDDKFDYVIENSGNDLHFLGLQVDQMMAVLSGQVIPYDEAQADVPPGLRKKL